MYYAFKIVLSALLLLLVSELGKRSSFWGAILASLPIMSVFAFAWIYIETQDTDAIASLSTGIAYLILPSMILFLALPVLLRQGLNFWLALVLSCIATALGYGLMLRLLRVFGISV